MLDPKTSQFWKAGIQSGLLDDESLSRCWEAIPPEKRLAAEHLDRRLGRQAVHLGLLTLWQAQQLLAGRVAGFRVDRYVLLNLIGQGGMGRVYLARDTRLNRQVALKILSPERMNNPRAIARFQREARVGAQLQHENLVRLYDFGESHGRHFLVMEFIEGRSLGFFIATEGRIPYALAARFCMQVALGLDHAHRKGLIHRDVNPYNVIVTNEGVAKLADMGLAIDLADEGRATRDGATVGTFDYVAPEQARHSHSADIRSDIYSLGCSLYHMISGQVPFPHPSLAEKLFAHQSQEPAPLDGLTPDLPPGLVEVVAKMMRKKPEERYQTPLELASALGPFAGKAASDRDPVLTAVFAETEQAVRSPEVAGPSMRSSTTGGEVGAGTSGEFSLGLEIPPEPLLSDATRTSKAWFGSGASRTPPSGSGTSPGRSASATSISAWNLAAASTRRGRWIAAAILLSIVGIYLGGPRLRRWLTAAPGDSSASRRSASPSTGKEAPRTQPQTIEWGDSSIAVLGSDGKVKPMPGLSQAIEIAAGGRGIVIFKGGRPIELKSGDGLNLTARGTLQLQGESGAATVLKIELNGKKPFLSLGSAVQLVMRNLTVEVHRSLSPGPGGSTPPLILAAGKGEFEHCEFRVTEGGYPGACAVRADGNGLRIDHCWFEGFEQAFEIHALAGASHVVRQSMFVPGGTPAEAVKARKPVRTGWAGKVHFEGGGARDGSRALRLEHCTVAGEGLLKLIGFSDSSKLELEVISCAVKGERLLDWQPSPTEASLTPLTIAWKGAGNQLDLVGASWISGPSSEDSIGGFDEWAARFAELRPVRSAIQFTMGPTTSDGHLTPGAYAILNADESAPGADVEDVGPRP